MGDEALLTQINDLDREHLQAFPPQRKAQVMNRIMSSAPARSVVLQGKNEYEKTVITIHRDGYGLIDMQLHENVFTSVWYRKERSFLGRGADVTMLLWEDGDNCDAGDSTTQTTWKL
jgi:hypothetical protein